jgi:hypothetical protein
MSDAPPSAPTPPAPAQETASPETPAKPETDWRAEAKKWESRAKENKSAADKLAAIEEANKTEAQKQADALTAAQREAQEAKADALRFKIAAKFSLSDEDTDLFLTGADEDTLTKQAQRLVEREAASRKNGNRVPREGATTPAAPNDERALVRQLFGGG